MLERVKPFSVKGDEFIKFSAKRGSLFINGRLTDKINDRFDYPNSCNVYVDTDEKMIILEFCSNGDYAFSINGTGTGASICFTRGKYLHIKEDRYRDCMFDETGVLFHYEVTE